MNYSDKRRQAEKEIMIHVVPLVRSKGFTGSFPVFRRFHEEVTDVVTFRFSPQSPHLYVELGAEPPFVDEAYPVPEEVTHSRYGEPARLGDSPFDIERHDGQTIAEHIVNAWPGAEIWWKQQA